MNQRFCSRPCHYANRRETTLREKGTTCRNCGERFHRSPAKMIGNFCSRRCFAEARLKPEIRICPDCGGPKAVAATRCNACWAKGRLRGDHHPCTHCGKPVYKSPAQLAQTVRHRGVFCNRKCHAAFVSGPNNPGYVDGKTPETYAPGFRTAKRQVMDRDGMKCFLCEDEKALDVHHIDRDRSNHALTNLVTLCRQCHAEQHRPPLTDIQERARSLSLRLCAKHSYPDPFTT